MDQSNSLTKSLISLSVNTHPPVIGHLQWVFATVCEQKLIGQCEGLALSPVHSQILSRNCGENSSFLHMQLQNKIWESPGNEASKKV